MHRSCFRLGTVLVAVCVMMTNGASGAPPRSSVAPGIFSVEQVQWEIELGDYQYTVPRIVGDRIFIGTNDTNLDHQAVASTGGAVLQCLDIASGQRLWQLPIPRYMPGTIPPFHFDHWKCGICSRPAVDGTNLYVVGPRGDVLCVDQAGQADGNTGPFVDEKSYFGVLNGTAYELQPTDGDIVWQFDMIESLDVIPHDVCGSSPAVCGSYVYACTSNGVDDTHLKIPHPQAPSLIVLDKRTGALVATDGAISGDRILHGTWSSPVVVDVASGRLVLFGGGDGILYAFKAPAEPIDGAVQPPAPSVLEVAWQYDACPSDYRMRDGQPIPYARWNKNSPEGPSEVISTPILHEGRVYVTIGQSPVHGPGQGCLTCLDVATGQRIWESRQVDRTLTDPVIADGLLFAADYSGRLHCLNADTGEHYWEHELLGGVWCESPVVVNGLVYIGNEKNRMWVLRASRDKEVVAQGRVRSTPITPIFENGILYFPTRHTLSAIQLQPPQ